MTSQELEVIAGLASLSALCLLAAGFGYTHWLWRQQHQPQHRAGGEGGNAPLAPAPVEVIRVAMDNATLDRERGDRLVVRPDGDVEIDRSASRERTEEMPRVEAPVVHVEVSEASTPLADVFVPLGAIVDDGLPRSLAAHVTDSATGDARHLDRIDGALRGYRARLDASGANSTIDRWLREGGYQPGLIEARRAAYPHCDDPSMEIPAADLAEALAIVAARAGAR